MGEAEDEVDRDLPARWEVVNGQRVAGGGCGTHEHTEDEKNVAQRGHHGWKQSASVVVVPRRHSFVHTATQVQYFDFTYSRICRMQAYTLQLSAITVTCNLPL
jgi:hypothetical protein